MKRVSVLCGLLFVGGLSISLAGMQVATGPTAASLSATKIEKIKDNLYMITGSNVNPIEAFAGGNTAVLVTETGVVVVDTDAEGILMHVLDENNSDTSVLAELEARVIAAMPQRKSS